MGNIKLQVPMPLSNIHHNPHGKLVSGEEMSHEREPMQQGTSTPSKQMRIFLLHYFTSLLTEKKIQKRGASPFLKFFYTFKSFIN